MENLINIIKTVLEQHIANGNQPNLHSETCRETIAQDILKLIENQK